MYFLTVILSAALLAGAFISPANAQAGLETGEGSPPAEAPGSLDSMTEQAERATEDAQISSGELERRLILARQIHELRPVSEQVSDALDYIGAELSPQEQAMFRQTVMATMNMDRLRSESVQAMAQTFTIAELSLMAEYYNQPESASIEEKSSLYRARIDPLIVEEINDALSRLQAAMAANNLAPEPAPLRPE